MMKQIEIKLAVVLPVITGVTLAPAGTREVAEQ